MRKLHSFSCVKVFLYFSRLCPIRHELLAFKLVSAWSRQNRRLWAPKYHHWVVPPTFISFFLSSFLVWFPTSCQRTVALHENPHNYCRLKNRVGILWRFFFFYLAAKQSWDSKGFFVFPYDFSFHKRAQQVLGTFSGSLTEQYLSWRNVWLLSCHENFVQGM